MGAVEMVLGLIAFFSKISEPDFIVDIHNEYGIKGSVDDMATLANARSWVT